MDKIDRAKLRELTSANAGRRGFTYTHYPMTAHNAACVREANAGGFTINVSANSPSHADSLASGAAKGLPIVTVLPASVDGANTPAGRPISVCPATYREDVSCATCQLCARGERKSIVGFPAHGSGAGKVSTIANKGV